MGPFLAQVVIGLWIPFTYYMFKRHPAPRATLYCFFGGLLTLPNWIAIKIPFFGNINKENVVGLAMIVVLGMLPLKGLRPRAEKWWYFSAIGLFISVLCTGMTNPDPIYFSASGTSIPGLGFKDTGALVVESMVGVLPVSYMGMRVFRKAEDLRLIVRITTLAGLIYSIPVLMEMRLSPQTHRWVYGFAGPHEWGQLVRYGGYRPLVLLAHGLVLSLFMLVPTVTATSLARSGGRIWKLSGNQAAWYLTLVVVLCKSTGVWFYAMIVLPLVRFASSKVVLRTAMVICLITVAYPWLRANDYIPTRDIIADIGDKDAERAQSMEVRFTNEDKLLARAMQRPFFGWGSYGRNRIFDEYGIDRCITDGLWVMTLGSLGFVGYGFLYMFSVGAMLIASSRIAKIRDTEMRNQMAALILCCAVLWFDTLPNAPNFFIVELVSAALCSISRTVLAEQEQARYRRRPVGVGEGGTGPAVAQAS